MTRARTFAALFLLVNIAGSAGAGSPPGEGNHAVLGALSAFGRAVAISGEYAFVGEPNNAAGRGGEGGRPVPVGGVVHVYRRGPAGWREVDKLTSSVTTPGDGFGMSLAVDGTTLLVGAFNPPALAGRGRAGGAGAAPVAPPVDSTPGTVFVFHRAIDGKWTPAGTLDATHIAGARYGTGLAIAGDLALIGAPGEASGGSVYLFHRGADGHWSAGGSLPAQEITAGDRFGSAIAIDGNRIAVGAPGHEVKGAVFLFHRAGDGTWTQETFFVSRRIPDNSQLGVAVALKGDRVFAGAPMASFAAPVAATVPAAPGAAPPAGGGGFGRGNAAPVPGVVVVFERNLADRWAEAADLMPFDMGSAAFGSSLAVVGDELWVGAPGSEAMGRVYRVRRDKSGGWSGMTKLAVDSIDPAMNPNAQFAASFAVAGDAAIIGMPGDGGGAGTVAFLGRTAAGNWSLRKVTFPPVAELYAAVSGREVKCNDGKASAFGCSNTGLMSFMPLSELGARRGVRLSDMFGWTDPLTGRDYALVGRTDGLAFVDVTDATHPRYLGDLMRTPGATMSSWREIKTYKNYAFVVSDGSGDHHGIQIFDLTRLRSVKTPQHFTEDAHYPMASVHDLTINTESGFAYAVGSAGGGETCGGGSHIVDIRDPRHPKFAACFADIGTGRRKTGYTHDIQCVMYHGPDTRFTGHEVCIAANETHISIQDVSDKSNIKLLSHVTYPDVAYAHQGWFTEDQSYWYEDDELDEGGFATTAGASGVAGVCPCGKAKEGTRTLIWDMKDLTDPVLAKEWIGTTHATDHNQFVKGNQLYQSNYRAGLRILDITDPVNPHEVGFLDTYPPDDEKDGGGAWGNYPWFRNGMIGVVSGGEGLFMVKDRTTTKMIP